MPAKDLRSEAYAALSGQAPEEVCAVELIAALQKIEALQPAALAGMREHGYVFDRRPSSEPPVTEADRWQDLAFWLYTDLCEANSICRRALKEISDKPEIWTISNAQDVEDLYLSLANSLRLGKVVRVTIEEVWT